MLKVLVVCHGNICRSPLAAVFLTSKGVDVRQGGFVNPGRRSPAKIRRSAEALRLNLETHRSRLVTQADIRWATNVLYMDGGNLKRLLAFKGVFEKSSCLATQIGEARIGDLAYMKEDSEEYRRTVYSIITCCRVFIGETSS